MTHDQELVLGGAVAGSMIGMYLTFAIIFTVLLIIALWKIFTKAGIAGWKSLIPIYNLYLLYKIANVNFWTWGFLPILAGSILSTFVPQNASSTEISPIIIILLIAIIVWGIIGTWKMSKGLATAFAKGTGFALGLFFLTNIFQLILGFGSAKYVGQKIE